MVSTSHLGRGLVVAIAAMAASPSMAQQPAAPAAPVSPPAAAKSTDAAPLQLVARFSSDGTVITGGLHWRVFADKPDQAGVYRLVKEDTTPQPTLQLPAGNYVVHVSMGLASASKPVVLARDGTREIIDITGGGIRLEGRVGNAKIPPGQISFDIYEGSQFDQADKRPIAPGIGTGTVLLVPEGAYYVVSKYGDGNALVRSDMRVASGKLTDITVTHRAAQIMFKLVSKRGGEALANTDWAVVSPAGDTITETKGAFPRVILAEGEYKVIARNDSKVYQQDLTVIPGVDGEIEVLAR